MDDHETSFEILSCSKNIPSKAIMISVYSLLGGFKVTLLHVKSSTDDHFLNDINIAQEVLFRVTQSTGNMIVQ